MTLKSIRQRCDTNQLSMSLTIFSLYSKTCLNKTQLKYYPYQVNVARTTYTFHPHKRQFFYKPDHYSPHGQSVT